MQASQSAQEQVVEAPRVVPFGKYILLDRIAVGGMAEMYLAKSFGVEGFEKLIAIKRILPSMAEDQDFINMFIDEAKIAGHLSHANIVPIYELGRIKDSHYIAMEFVWGKDLLQIINRFRKMRRRTPPAMAAWIASRICAGLGYAHAKKDRSGKPLGLIHRDVSPQNVLVNYDGQVKLIDFGIAKAASRNARTETGVLKGKFGYMSPEQVQGKRIDHRSDLFAVGTCLYELLICDRLFVSTNDIATLELVGKAAVDPPSKRVSGIPRLLDAIVMKALARNPERRYQNAGEFLADLQLFLNSQSPAFATHELSAWMQEAFADDHLQEEKRLDAFREVGRSRVPGRITAHGSESPAGRATSMHVGDAGRDNALDSALDSSRDSASLSAARVEAQHAEARFAEKGKSARDEGSGTQPPVDSRFDAATELPADATQVTDMSPALRAFGHAEGHPENAERSTARPPDADTPGEDVLDTGSLRVDALLEKVSTHSGGAVFDTVRPDLMTGGFDEIGGASTEIFFSASEVEPDEDDTEAMDFDVRRSVLAELGMSDVTGPRRSNLTVGVASDAWTGHSTPPTSLPEGAEVVPAGLAKRYARVRIVVASLATLCVGLLVALLVVTGNHRPVTVEIKTNPAIAASVYIDGVVRGRTPFKLVGVTPGERQITLEADGYLAASRSLYVNAGESWVLEVAMLPSQRQGPVGAPATREGGRSLEGADADVRNADKLAERPSKNRGGAASEEEVEYGELVVHTIPPARVFVNGEDTERTTPILSMRIPAGRHRIGLQTRDGKTHRETIEVKAGEVVKLIRRL